MRKKAFTLVEIMIALIIVAVVASLSIVTFQKTIDANNDRICRQNLKTLQQAIEIYTIENNALPVTLSLLTQEQIHLARAKVIGKPKENRLASLFNNLIGIKPLFADLGKYYGNDLKVRRCPADKTVSADPDYSSYSMNPNNIFTYADDLDDYPDTVLMSDKIFYHKKDMFSGDTYQIAISPSGKYGTFTLKADDTITQDDDISFLEVIEPLRPCSEYDENKEKCNKISTGCIWKKDSGCVTDECAAKLQADCTGKCKWNERKDVCRTKDKDDD